MLPAALTALTVLVAPVAEADRSCASVAVRDARLALVVITRGPVECPLARKLVRGFFAAKVGFRTDRQGVHYRPVSGWRCYTALAGSQARCTRGGREVIGDTAWPGGFVRCAPPVPRVYQLRVYGAACGTAQVLARRYDRARLGSGTFPGGSSALAGYRCVPRQTGRETWLVQCSKGQDRLVAFGWGV